ncbi:MAG: nicotinamide-nucleotide amidohydrolase family protein, partial [Pseudolabrys sp.]
MDMLKHLANEVIQCPKAGDLMACTAESCSAGKLAMVLSKAEGASKYFLGGMVAYTKEMKTRLLSVPSDLIHRDTAVSAGVAEAMAQGASRSFNADLGVSITGVAGPEPDEDGNPVGLVY